MLFASNIKLPSSSLIENAGKSNEWASYAAPDFKEKWTKLTGTMIFIFARLGQSAQLFLSWKPLNNSNDNDDDDDNDNNDNNKTVPTKRESRRAARPRRNNDVKKMQQQQPPSTRRVEDSP